MATAKLGIDVQIQFITLAGPGPVSGPEAGDDICRSGTPPEQDHLQAGHHGQHPQFQGAQLDVAGREDIEQTHQTTHQNRGPDDPGYQTVEGRPALR